MQLTVRDVAAILNVSEKTVYRWIQHDELPAYRVNEQYRFNRAELLEWATARKLDVSATLFESSQQGGGTASSLSDALEAGGIFHHVQGMDKPSVLRTVVELMRLPAEIDRGLLLSVLLAREAVGSTGIGGGIAIPHARNPIVLPVEHPLITLCFLDTPIEFGAMDHKPVHALFTLMTPAMRVHLNLISRLAFALSDPAFQGLITMQAPATDILRDARRLDERLRSTPVEARA